jgi:hypothetical protein
VLDREVRRDDVQGLSSRDALAAFFAGLSYATDSRIVQTPANLGITSDSVVRQITHLERLAVHDDWLQVYLVELSSLTLSGIRGIASALRNRAGDYLLVVTADYVRLDFVLLEKIAPKAEPTSSFSQRQISIRPRIVGVDRRNPSKVQLRVLRRLTYTETDALAQWDKLKSAFDTAFWSSEHFNNRALFADYYLSERLPELPEWRDDSKPTFKVLRQLYDRAAARWAQSGEQELRAGLLEPALRALGYELVHGKPARDDSREPDYRLRAPDGSVIAVCLAYRWNRFLDGKDDQRDTETPEENPGALVVSLLERAEAPFAIVTNGKHWRLYTAKTHSRATNYYEIDLEETLALDDPNEAFRYFWLLFRCAALAARDIVVDGESRRTTFVEQLLEQSEQFAKRLGERLKDRIFTDIFPHFAAGFVAHIRAERGRSTALEQDELDAVFQGTLTLLYRLLFLLYAEARDLLPVREVRAYHEASLAEVTRQIAATAGDDSEKIEAKLERGFSSSSFELYDRLSGLFAIVDRGDPDRNVPIYNGGLFLSHVDPNDQTSEAANARFLLSHKISDRFLALGLDWLTRDEDDKTFQRVAIDYKSLDVRHLGSIYEGLLEFRLRIAPEKMAICKGKKTEEVVPYTEAKEKGLKILTEGRGKETAERTLPKGAVYLENDKRERKATGSYYTPDYIVKYIVEQTVGPMAQQRFDAMRPLLREAQKTLRAKQEKAKALQKGGGKSDDPAQEAFLHHRDVVDRLFDLKVLDPAMGSGHFLVEAVDFLTDRMLDFLNGFPWNPVVHQLKETREAILRDLEEQHVSVDQQKLTDVNLLKRHVLKRCIYGVDINPMAVELAKLSLWLRSFTLGAPLSFLDHHLKCGNSLIGATVEDVNKSISAGQLSLLAGTRFAKMKQAVAGMIHVGELSDVTAAQVRESRHEFQLASDALAPAKRLLDVYTSQWFGNAPTRRGKGKQRVEYAPALEFLRDASSEQWAQQPDNARLSSQSTATVTTAVQFALSKRFFHWDLEFPEVFYGPEPGTTQKIERRPDGGFDAVVGNPPWIRQETLQSDKSALAGQFADVFDSVADIYVFFLVRGLSILSPSRLLGVIVPNKWHRAAYGEQLRRLLAEREQLVTLIDFGHAPLFPDADTFPCILIVRHKPPSAEVAEVQVCSVPREALPTLHLPEFVEQNARPVPVARMSPKGWDLESSAVADLLDKIRGAGIPLKDYIGSSPLYGIKTGYNEAFLIDQTTRDRLVAEDPKCEPIIKKFLRGRDIQRWHPQWDGQWMIVLKSSENHQWPWANAGEKAQALFRKAYPSLCRHMVQHEERLRKRQDKGRYWWELRSCDYYVQLDGPKVIYQDIAFHSWFAVDQEGMYSNNTCYFVPGADLSLLTVLNSSVVWWWLSRRATHAKDEAFRLHGIFMEELPVPAATRNAEQIANLTRILVDRSATRQRFTSSFFDWLKGTVGTERVTARLEEYWRLDAKTLNAEVKRAGAPKLTPAAQRLLAAEHARQVAELTPILAETRRLEIELQHLVFDLYGLTPEEVQLLRSTAPPRDPLALVEASGPE